MAKNSSQVRAQNKKITGKAHSLQMAAVFTAFAAACMADYICLCPNGWIGHCI